MTSFNLLLANDIQDMTALKWVFRDLRLLARKLVSPFGHTTEVSTRDQLAASVLASPFAQGFTSADDILVCA